jgi:hypothetical protein
MIGSKISARTPWIRSATRHSKQVSQNLHSMTTSKHGNEMQENGSLQTKKPSSSEVVDPQLIDKLLLIQVSENNSQNHKILERPCHKQMHSHGGCDERQWDLRPPQTLLVQRLACTPAHAASKTKKNRLT